MEVTIHRAKNGWYVTAYDTGVNLADHRTTTWVFSEFAEAMAKIRDIMEKEISDGCNDS